MQMKASVTRREWLVAFLLGSVRVWKRQDRSIWIDQDFVPYDRIILEQFLSRMRRAHHRQQQPQIAWGSWPC